MIVRVPFTETNLVTGGILLNGFSFYCECGEQQFTIVTTEDPFVPLLICTGCRETYLVADLQDAQLREVPP